MSISLEMKNIAIPNKKALEEKIEKIKKSGIKALHVISDFDRTLTKAFVKGKFVPSLISVLRDGNYLTPDYAEKAHALFNKYHPIEASQEIPIEEKKEKMHEWWTSHFQLLIKSGLNKRDLERAVETGNVEFRKGAEKFLDILHDNNIPLVILSSSGLGGDAIEIFLRKHKRLYDNIHIISNVYEWDKKGNAIGVKEPIIHTLNKHEVELKNLPVYQEIKNRKNIILLGDGIDDLGMVEGFPYKTLIKVGFLNQDVDKLLTSYKENFDVVITNDSGMNYVNKLVKSLRN